MVLLLTQLSHTVYSLSSACIFIASLEIIRTAVYVFVSLSVASVSAKFSSLVDSVCSGTHALS